MTDSAQFGKGVDTWTCSQMRGWGQGVAGINWYKISEEQCGNINKN